MLNNKIFIFFLLCILCSPVYAQEIIGRIKYKVRTPENKIKYVEIEMYCDNATLYMIDVNNNEFRVTEDSKICLEHKEW